MEGNKKTLVLCFFVFTLSAVGVFFCFFQKNVSTYVLEELSQQERDDLKTFCQYLIKETEFGYTLFGTKPVTLISPENSNEMVLNSNCAFYENGILIVKKIINKIKIDKYLVCIEKNNDKVIAFYFINKPLLAKTLNENRGIFIQLGCADPDPDNLLSEISKNGNFMEVVCNNNSALLGMCLGYGVQNSLNVGREMEIRKYLSLIDVPPWNTKNIDLSDDVKKSLGFDDAYSDMRRLCKQRRPVHCLTPSANFSSLEEELRFLQNRTQRSANCILPDISSVNFPLFFCDRKSEETIALLKNYRRQQKLLQKILVSDNIVEKILEKLIDG